MNPNVHMMLINFVLHKPWWLRWLKNWNMCCCWYHQELKELLQGCNDMRVDGRGIHNDHTCSCTNICVMNANDTHPNICHAIFWTSSSLTTLWMSILCENLSQMLNGIKEVVLWVSVLATRWRNFLCAQLSSV